MHKTWSDGCFRKTIVNELSDLFAASFAAHVVYQTECLGARPGFFNPTIEAVAAVYHWSKRFQKGSFCAEPPIEDFFFDMLGRSRILWLRSCGTHGMRGIQSVSSSSSSKSSKFAGALGVGLLGATGTWAIWMKTASNEGRTDAGQAGTPPAPTAEGWAASMKISAGRLQRQSTMFDKEESDEICVTVRASMNQQAGNACERRHICTELCRV
jgi:hypothetical protein